MHTLELVRTFWIFEFYTILWYKFQKFKKWKKILGYALGKIPFLTFPACFSISQKFSNLNYNCSKFWDLRNLQEQVKKTFCFENCSVRINCSSDLKILQNSQPSALNLKHFSLSLDLRTIFLAVGQKNLWNKIPFWPGNHCFFLREKPFGFWILFFALFSYSDAHIHIVKDKFEKNKW